MPYRASASTGVSRTSRERRTPIGAGAADAARYAASAAFAGIVALGAAIPLQRSWGSVAVWAYIGGALLAAALARSHLDRRLALAIAVMVGATLVPLALAASARSPTDRGATAQSEVLIVEEGATALVRGHDPYAVAYGSGPLASRPEPTRTHVPYPPAMLVFGLPKALAGAGPITDARVWFLLATLGVAIPTIRAMRADPDGRLLTFEVLLVLPTGALLLATGGHDVPVLATLLASIVLADRGRSDAAGAAAGLALAMRQTSVLAVPFILAIVPRERRLRAAAWTALPLLVLSLPFLVWDAGAFVEDTVLFPLGLGTGASSARTPTLGSALLELVPEARTAITIGLVLAIVIAVGALLLVRTPTTAGGASARAAAAFLVAVVLAPAARFGYLVYPISFAVWAFALARGARATGSARATATG